MILGLASPTYGSNLPVRHPLLWLLDRCCDYGLKALESSLPIDHSDDPDTVRRKAADLGIVWIPYWRDDFVTPDGGETGLRERAQRAFEIANAGGVATLILFGTGNRHTRFTREPPLAEQQRRMVHNLPIVATAAAEASLKLGLLPHLDYRAAELVEVMKRVNHPALKMAFDTANAFPVCEEPLEAARVTLPHAIAVALKDLRIYPHRSGEVTQWGTPLGRGSVDFENILPLLDKCLPRPEETTVSIKLRLPDGTRAYDEWLRESLDFLRPRLPK